ncbi:MAG: aspartate-semialdehyde dehydrogenase [Candidatus Thiodiazotropha sp. (ex Myrtea sp. 'scaly one' KF741663)]|nr:aspartate-semialdehyde dehydrogenase [Candidatus Thiodiazotropha sp. (ex Myrtea sp. 'scaly one' KF741663)]
MDNSLKLAIFGANGLVTESLLGLIADHRTLQGEIVLLGDEDNAGEPVEFGRQTLIIAEAALCDFSEVDILVSTGEAPCGSDWLAEARDAGCVILDIGGQLRAHSDLPLVAAEVNPGVLDGVTRGSFISLPDAATLQCATLLKPLMDQVGLERVSLFSCQAVSELGQAGVEEIARQSAQMLNGKPARPLLFPRQVAFNMVPLALETDNRDTQVQEKAVAQHVGELLDSPALPLTVSCCWVPVFFGHTQAIHFSTSRETDLESLKRIYRQTPYVELNDDAQNPPTAVTDASGKNVLVVGNLIARAESKTDFSLLGVADNLRYGIAGNAVKIIEVLVKRLFLSYS